MLKYTFSTREKILLALILVVAIGVAWYQLLYTPIQNQISLVDEQINSTQDEILVRQGTAASMKEMEERIAEYEAQGLTPVYLPDYDNTRQLMIYLNATLGAANEYSINFDNPADNEDGTVHRLGGITFSADSYDAARSIIDEIANGPYFCTIDALSVSDRSATSEKGEGTCEIRLDVTYYETGHVNPEAVEEDTTPEGNDLSGLINWDKQ